MSLFVAIAGSYLLVAVLGFALGRIHAELQIREARSWPELPPTDWPKATPLYDWAADELAACIFRHPAAGG